MQKENITQPQPIDLGLPSGTLWADRNLGAESATDYGDYYMWGSTEPCTDKVCYWRHAPFTGDFKLYNEDVFEVFRKEAFPDGILSDQYDTAHVQLGGNWHMPTMEQFQELLEFTDSKWISLEGIRGCQFTSKTNGNAIFMPTSGYRYCSSVNGVGSGACLWSSTLNSSDMYDAYTLSFLSGDCFVDYYRRYYGFCIRPVHNR